MKNNNSIVITEADKRVEVVILDAAFYRDKILQIYNDEKDRRK